MSFLDDVRDSPFSRYQSAARPILDETFSSCRDAVAELEDREAWARETGSSVSHLVAQLDPETARMRIVTRAQFLASCKSGRERALVEYADPDDAMRIVMLDGKGSGRSVSVPEFKRVLAALEAEVSSGR
jgi:hypothetical protein